MHNTTVQRIKAIRKQKNMHQREVAEQLNISQSTYAKMEQGNIKLDTDRMIALAKIFDVAYEDFLPTQADRNISFSNNQITTGFIEHYYDGIKDIPMKNR